MPLLLVAAFLSGVAALNYELLWMRELTLVTGSTSAAISCLISVYFLGLALGNELAGRFVGRLSNPFRFYALIEFAIAGWVVLFHPLLAATSSAYGGFYRALDPQSPMIPVLRVAGAAILMLPPTICMGATLPLLAHAAARDVAHASRWSATLYGVNTLGAMTGVFATGFFLIERFGVSTPLFATALLNVLCGLCVVMLPRRASATPDERPARPTDGDASRRAVALDAPPPVLFVIACFAVLGFANIAVEVLWTRYFALIFLNDTYVFSTILLTYLAGVGVGSLVAGKFVARVRRPMHALGILQLISAAWTAAMLFIVPALLPLMQLDSKSFATVVSNYVVAVGIGALVPTLCMGASFPLVVRILVNDRQGTGRVVGRALSWNTVGGVLGSAVAGYVLLDRFKLETAIYAVVAITAAVGVLLVFKATPSRRRAWLPVSLILGPPALAAIVRPVHLPDDLLQVHFPPGGGFRVLESAPSVHGHVAVTEETGGERRIWINSIWVARESAHVVMGYVPWLFHHGDVRSALGICCGTGRTFGALLNLGVDRLDLVEINPAVIDLSRKWFGRSNHGVLDDSRARVIIDDGRNHVRYTDRTYDLITLEPLQMFQKGVVYFYTEEFYRQARARLTDGGVICQWAPAYLATPDEFKSMIHTFVRVFPDSILWGQGIDMLLIGFNVPESAAGSTIPNRARFDLDSVFARMTNAALREDLRRNFVYDRYDPLVFTLLDGPAMLAMSSGAAVYTDDRPSLEFTAPRGRDEKQSAKQNMALIRSRLVPLTSLFDLRDPAAAKRLAGLRELFLELAVTDRGPQWDDLTRRIIALRDSLYAGAP